MRVAFGLICELLGLVCCAAVILRNPSADVALLAAAVACLIAR